MCQDWRKESTQVISSAVPVTPPHWLQFHIQTSHINQISTATFPLCNVLMLIICMKNSKPGIIWNIYFCSHLTINTSFITSFPDFDKRYRHVICDNLAAQRQSRSSKKYKLIFFFFSFFFNFSMKTLCCMPWCVYMLDSLPLCTLQLKEITLIAEPLSFPVYTEKEIGFTCFIIMIKCYRLHGIHGGLLYLVLWRQKSLHEMVHSEFWYICVTSCIWEKRQLVSVEHRRGKGDLK